MHMLERRGTRLIVHLPVELDHHHTEDIRMEVDKRLQEEPIEKLEFDFAKTVFMDSAGIGMILGRYKIMRALDGQVVLNHMSGQIRRILYLSGIQRFIQLDKEEAV